MKKFWKTLIIVVVAIVLFFTGIIVRDELKTRREAKRGDIGTSSGTLFTWTNDNVSPETWLSKYWGGVKLGWMGSGANGATTMVDLQRMFYANHNGLAERLGKLYIDGAKMGRATDLSGSTSGSHDYAMLMVELESFDPDKASDADGKAVFLASLGEYATRYADVVKSEDGEYTFADD